MRVTSNASFLSILQRHTIMQLNINFYSIWFGIPLAGFLLRPQSTTAGTAQLKSLRLAGVGCACLAHQSPARFTGTHTQAYTHTYTQSVWQLTCCIYVNLPHMAIAALELCARVWKLSKKVGRNRARRGGTPSLQGTLISCQCAQLVKDSRGGAGSAWSSYCSWSLGHVRAAVGARRLHYSKLPKCTLRNWKCNATNRLPLSRVIKSPHAHTHNKPHTHKCVSLAARERHSHRRWKITSALGCKTAAFAIPSMWESTGRSRGRGRGRSRGRRRYRGSGSGTGKTVASGGACRWQNRKRGLPLRSGLDFGPRFKSFPRLEASIIDFFWHAIVCWLWFLLRGILLPAEGKKGSARVNKSPVLSLSRKLLALSDLSW